MHEPLRQLLRGLARQGELLRCAGFSCCQQRILVPADLRCIHLPLCKAQRAAVVTTVLMMRIQEPAVGCCRLMPLTPSCLLSRSGAALFLKPAAMIPRQQQMRQLRVRVRARGRVAAQCPFPLALRCSASLSPPRPLAGAPPCTLPCAAATTPQPCELCMPTTPTHTAPACWAALLSQVKPHLSACSCLLIAPTVLVQRAGHRHSIQTWLQAACGAALAKSLSLHFPRQRWAALLWAACCTSTRCCTVLVLSCFSATSPARVRRWRKPRAQRRRMGMLQHMRLRCICRTSSCCRMHLQHMRLRCICRAS